jgi:glycosyltransferase involved in cell wall biosynthesis
VAPDGISVAMGTRNGAAYIEQQLASVLAQTVPVSEIVISDDDSRDGTLDIATRVVADRVPLRVLRNAEPLGVTRNFEQAIAATSGEIVALCDQDDVWRSDRIAVALDALAAEPGAELVFSDARIVDGNGRPTGDRLFDLLEISDGDLSAIRRGGAFDLLVRRNLVTGATVLVRRRLIDAASPFPSSWVHDEWLAMMAAATSSIAVVRDPLVDYRLHGGNEIGARRPTLRVKLARVLESRADRNERLARRSADLADRLAGMADLDESLRSAARGKALFEGRRSALPARRLARIPAVAGFLRRGEYARFASQGHLDAVRDLLQAP